MILWGFGKSIEQTFFDHAGIALKILSFFMLMVSYCIKMSVFTNFKNANWLKSIGIIEFSFSLEVTSSI